jgi:sugar/nucleoside kinase (ribokinase family)
MPPHYDVFLPGDYCYDLIYSGLNKFPEPGCEVYGDGILSTGGGMYTVAVALHRLGVQVGWSPCFGNDYYSGFVRQLALDEGLDLLQAKEVDAPYRRISTAIPFEGERAFVSYMDVPPCNMIAHWSEAMQRCSFQHLHMGAVTTLDQMMALVDNAHERGATVSLDSQDVPNLKSACDWSKLLKRIDIFMPNAREARIITGVDHLERAIRRLMQWVKIVVVKDGANGAWLGTAGQVTRIPGIQIDPVIDTTGAGDCFLAGFLAGYVCDRVALDDCVRYGNICGALSVTAVGGSTAAPTHADVLARMATYPAQ